MTSKRYDVITADIIHPYNAGAGNLYSLESFQLAANALRDDGVMVQWVGQQPVTQYKLIARTFLGVFRTPPSGAAERSFSAPSGRFGSQWRPTAAAAGRRVRARARGAGIAGFGGLMQLYTAGPEELRRFVGAGPVLTDDRPLVEYFLSLPRRGADR